MPGVKDPFRSRFHPCKHVHVSGRRCGNWVPKDTEYCPLHGDLHGGPSRYRCAECDSMMQSFIPPKGW